MRVFVAGAAGTIGRRLIPLLVDAGHEVFGTTRSADKATDIGRAGARPVVVDVFDVPLLKHALAKARPEIVIHQLTDLPPGLDPKRMAEALPRNARIRDEGTRNLAAAALAAGARRLISQSVAWLYAPGREPHVEDDPLDVAAQGTRAVSVGGVVALERATLAAAPLEGVVLRYGNLYGPGTGREAASGDLPLHVDAAAQAALLATVKGTRGIFNIAEPNPHVSSDKAARELGWDPYFRLASGTK